MRDGVATLRRTWWLPALFLVLGGVAGVAVSWLVTPEYTSRGQLFVSTTNSTSASDVYQGSQFSQQRVASYVPLFRGDELASRVIKRLGLPMSTQDLTKEVTATAVFNTVLIDVSVTDDSPRRAQLIATTYMSEFTSFVADLEASRAGAGSPIKVTVTNSPEVPRKPSSPRVLENVAFGLVGGLVLGTCLQLARGRLDRAVRRPEDAARAADTAVLGAVPRDKALRRHHIIDRSSANAPAEAARKLRSNLLNLDEMKPPTVILVTAPARGAGVSTVVANLALALAEAGRRVTVVDADLRGSAVSTYLGGEAFRRGLSDVLQGLATLDDVLQEAAPHSVRLIAAGSTVESPSPLLASDAMAQLLEQLRERSDYVLIDGPPVLDSAGVGDVAVLADGVLVVARCGTTTREELAELREALDSLGARTSGAVLTMVTPERRKRSESRPGRRSQRRMSAVTVPASRHSAAPRRAGTSAAEFLEAQAAPSADI